MNAKTADKDLQFSHEKCKTMFVSKVKPKSYHKLNLTVDTWELSVEKGVIKEEFRGKVPIEDENSLMYLGFMLSNRGLNIEILITNETEV